MYVIRGENMPLYKYKARDRQGKLIKGLYEADDKNYVLNHLREQNYYPLYLEEYYEGKDLLDYFRYRKVRIRDIAVFCRQFATLITSGVSIIECLDILKKQSESNTLKEALGEIYEDVQKGKSLTETLKNYRDIFPLFLINMIEVGEASGNLDKVLERAANHYEKEYRLKQKIKAAMTYPIMVTIVAFMIVVFLITYVLPTFVSLFASVGAVLPLPTRILLKISNIFNNYWYVILGLLVIIYFLVKQYINSEKGSYQKDMLKLTLPFYKKFYTKVITSQFTRTLGILLNSGVPIIQSLDILSKVVDNKIISDNLEDAKELVKKGNSLSKVLNNMKIFSPMVIQMVSIGEESGALDRLLEKTADFFDNEVENTVNQMASLIEPLIIIALALVVGFVVVSIALPIYELMGKIGY